MRTPGRVINECKRLSHRGVCMFQHIKAAYEVGTRCGRRMKAKWGAEHRPIQVKTCLPGLGKNIDFILDVKEPWEV